MLKRRWIHHTKALLVAAATLGTVGALAGLLWLNERGFEGKWGERIAAELAQHGIHAEFQMVRFSPTRGVTAHELVIYSDARHQEVFAHIPRLHFEIDRGKALRGELHIRRVILHDADLFIPLSTDGSRQLAVANLSGRASLDRQGRFTLEEARGELAGMPFRLAVQLDAFEVTNLARKRTVESAARRDEFLAGLFTEVSRWSFPPEIPPAFGLRITGSVERPERIRTAFTLEAGELTRSAERMKDIRLAGELQGRTLRLDRLDLSDGHGSLAASGSYDLHEKAGRYELSSSLRITDVLRRTLGDKFPEDLVSEQAPRVTAQGRFELGEHGPRLFAIGDLAWPLFSFRGNAFENLTSEFSWQDGNLFLRNLSVAHGGGELSGRLLIDNDTIRYEATSTLPLAAFRPFLKRGGALDFALARTSFTEDSKAFVEAEGSIQRDNLRAWVARGRASFERFAYNHVPLTRASAEFALSPLEGVYRHVEAEFDYRSYALRRRHGGPDRAVVRAEDVRHDTGTKLTHVDRLRGTAWPAPVLRLFVPKSADFVEQEFGFRAPPQFDATGVIDAASPGRRTDITTRVQAAGTTDYRFLDRTLQFARLAGTVRTRHRLHDLTDLRFHTLGGTGGGKLTVQERPGRAAAYRGGIKWTDIRLPELSRKYNFPAEAQGRITGRIDFRGVLNNIRSFHGDGVIGLRDGQLFDVPVFGPLSAPISGVLGDKRFSHEQARDASATFVVEEGVAYTRDFLTSTPSTVFTGEGNVDLATKHLDMTVRVNARGLLGLVTLPLRPFNGLFQFHGRGPLRAPVWSGAPFTEPSRGRSDPVFQPPPRARIVPER